MKNDTVVHFATMIVILYNISFSWKSKLIHVLGQVSYVYVANYASRVQEVVLISSRYE